MAYTIKEASELTGVSVHTLRYYDKQGLFPDMERTDARYRMFSDNELEEIRLIHCFKIAGLQIKEIKEYMDMVREGNSTLSKRLDYMKAQYGRIEDEIQKLERAKKMIRFKVAYYEAAIKVGGVEMLKPEMIPEKYHIELKEALDSSDQSVKKEG